MNKHKTLRLQNPEATKSKGLLMIDFKERNHVN